MGSGASKAWGGGGNKTTGRRRQSASNQRPLSGRQVGPPAAVAARLPSEKCEVRRDTAAAAVTAVRRLLSDLSDSLASLEG